jgi:hypothetical protein
VGISGWLDDQNEAVAIDDLDARPRPQRRGGASAPGLSLDHDPADGADQAGSDRAGIEEFEDQPIDADQQDGRRLKPQFFRYRS